MARCLCYENDWENYSHYVHGFWIPYLQQLKNEGILTEGMISLIVSDFFHIGQITFEIPNNDLQGTVHRYKYIGSLKGDKAFGQGFATRIDNERDFIIGTFKDNVPHGIGRS